MKDKTQILEQAKQDLEKGKVLLNEGKYADAIEVFEKVAPVFEEVEDWEGYIGCLNECCVSLYRRGKYEAALKKASKAWSICQEKLKSFNQLSVSSLGNLGTVYWFKGDYDKAIYYISESLNRQIANSEATNLDIGGAYYNLGLVYQNKGDFNEALIYQQKGLDIYLKILGEQHSRTADSYNNFGIIYKGKGDYQNALIYFNRALNIYSQILKKGNPKIGNAFGNLGVLYQKKSEYHQAIAYFNKSLHIFLEALGEAHPKVAGIYNSLGVCYMHIKDYKKSINCYHLSINKYLIHLSEDHMTIGDSWMNMGVTYSKMGKQEKAISYYYKGLGVFLGKEGGSHPSTVRCFQNLGIAYRNQGKYLKAMSYFDKALQVQLAVFGRIHEEVALLYTNIAHLFLLKKKYTQSLRYYQLALKSVFADFSENDYYQNPNLQNFPSYPVLLEILQSKAQTFLQYYTQETQNPKDLQAALSTYHLATELIAQMRQGYKAEGSKLILAEKATAVFDGAIEAAILIAQSENLDDTFTVRRRLERVFQYSEQSKAVLLLSSIKDTEAKAKANIPEELLQKEYDLRIELTYLDKRIQQEELKLEAKKDESQIREWQSQHFDYQQEYDQLIQKFEKDYPEYYELKYQIQTATVATIQNLLNNVGFRNPMLLSYHLSPKKIYIFQITPNDYQIHEIERPENFAELIEDFQDAMILARIKNYLQSAGKLFNLLLKPALSSPNIQNTDKLILIPHNELATLPFDALIDTRKLTDEIRQELIAQRDFSALPYLVKDYDISYHYSATLLLNSAKRQEKTAQQAPSFIGFAPVTFKGKGDSEADRKSEQTELAIATNRGKTRILRSNRSGQMAMDNLPNTESEVKEVFQLFEEKELDAKAFLYASANKQNLLKNAQSHKYVLIATHGYVQDGNAGLSGIYLARGREIGDRNEEVGKKESDTLKVSDSFSITRTHKHLNTTTNTNYILHTSEAYHLPLNADLVVLSSCSSGVGKMAKGEGMMAINRGFLYAGASNIVFTHFDVPDESSGELVKALFMHILEGDSYSSALRKAKVALLSDSLKTPEDWAGYALIGG